MIRIALDLAGNWSVVQIPLVDPRGHMPGRVRFTVR
jgi:hypothetical protein